MARICFRSQVNPALLDAYKDAHAAVWPAMLEALRDTGWRDYSLFLDDDGLLIGVVEVDDSLDAAQRRMAATEVNAAWQAEMGALFADADAPPDEGFVTLPEVFNLDAQLTAAGLPTHANYPPATTSTRTGA
ncbi:L-rhamnose mutarotase [Propioniciclava soli]|uniref:L-rhamnose mutarotase n=1 Tax=Propioniciclava soli TaxID=2775081 RepID=A0ABZ3C9D6_9ACTN